MLGGRGLLNPRHSTAVAVSVKRSMPAVPDKGSRPPIASLATPWTIDHASRAMGFGSPGGNPPPIGMLRRSAPGFQRRAPPPPAFPGAGHTAREFQTLRRNAEDSGERIPHIRARSPESAPRRRWRIPPLWSWPPSSDQTPPPPAPPQFLLIAKMPVGRIVGHACPPRHLAQSKGAGAGLANEVEGSLQQGLPQVSVMVGPGSLIAFSLYQIYVDTRNMY